MVFSQFDNDGENHYTELKQKNIDTGMGLERLAAVCQGVPSLFDVDTVMNITAKVTEITGASYGQSHATDVSLRVITDHIRSATFMICDGVLPSNEGRGYVLRRLLRRAEHPACKDRAMGAQQALFHPRNAAQVAADSVDHEKPPERENSLRSFYSNFQKFLGKVCKFQLGILKSAFISCTMGYKFQ